MISGCNPIILISGDYNAFATGYNGCGIYGFSGLVQTESFKTPIYVGSAIDEKYRITQSHMHHIENKTHPNKPLLNYIYKYGLENIVIFELEKAEPIKESLLKIEQKYIDYYGVAYKGEAFNILPTAGSTLGRKLSEETIRKMKKKVCSEETKRKLSENAKTWVGEKNPFYGKKHTDASKKIISEKLKGKMAGEKNPNYGKKHDEETRRKIGLASIGRDCKNKKKVKQIDIKTGEVIKIWDSASDATRELNNGKIHGHISRVCHGKLNKTLGFKWEYVVDDIG